MSLEPSSFDYDDDDQEDESAEDPFVTSDQKNSAMVAGYSLTDGFHDQSSFSLLAEILIVPLLSVVLILASIPKKEIRCFTRPLF